MLTDYEPDPVVTCRHKWAFRCWYKDVGTGESSTLRYLVERCHRCALVRITHYCGRIKMKGYSYAENMEDALLGRPYTLRDLAGVLHN